MSVQRTRALENQNKHRTSQNFKMYADVSALRNLLDDSGVGMACWKIKVFGTGTLVLRPVHKTVTDSSGDVTLPAIAAGDVLELSCSALVSGTATNILVMW